MKGIYLCHSSVERIPHSYHVTKKARVSTLHIGGHFAESLHGPSLFEGLIYLISLNMASKTGTPTKTTRRSVTTTTTTQRASASGDDSMSTSSPGRRARSPSPARITRNQEKEQLQNLNDRLAAYIDRVRFLETENSRLTVQIKSVEETVNRDRSNIKAVYQSELDDARRLLDETAREKARLQIEVGKYKEEAEDWKIK